MRASDRYAGRGGWGGTGVRRTKHGAPGTADGCRRAGGGGPALSRPRTFRARPATGAAATPDGTSPPGAAPARPGGRPQNHCQPERPPSGRNRLPPVDNTCGQLSGATRRRASRPCRRPGSPLSSRGGRGRARRVRGHGGAREDAAPPRNVRTRGAVGDRCRGIPAGGGCLRRVCPGGLGVPAGAVWERRRRPSARTTRVTTAYCGHTDDDQKRAMATRFSRPAFERQRRSHDIDKRLCDSRATTA